MKKLKAVLEQGAVEASAPCRIDMGGTLDLSTFHLPLRHLGPCTFNAALDMRTSVRLHPHTRGMIKITSRGFDGLEVESSQASFSHPMGLIVAVAAYFQADGVHIQIDSASPPRSALGGSSVAAAALIWAFAKALNKTGQPMPGHRAVALLAHALEQSLAGVPCGIQDQLAAVYGGVNGWYWLAEPGGELFRRREVVAPDACPEFSRHLLVAYCGVPHVSKDINGSWVRDFLSGRQRAEWHQIAALSRQFIDAMAGRRYDEAVALMNRETDLRLTMTPEVLDEVGRPLAAVAREYGCAARFTGAGGGGCVWALGQPTQIQALRPAWEQILSSREEAKILDTQVDPIGIL